MSSALSSSVAWRIVRLKPDPRSPEPVASPRDAIVFAVIRSGAPQRTVLTIDVDRSDRAGVHLRELRLIALARELGAHPLRNRIRQRHATWKRLMRAKRI